jgi:hypothetical protein
VRFHPNPKVIATRKFKKHHFSPQTTPLAPDYQPAVPVSTVTI